ncbi:MAG TPA: c-type cytochrome [Puia sp.]|nr:c-type cytochrome [Puia sp.]
MRHNFLLLLSGALLIASCGGNSGNEKTPAKSDTSAAAAPAPTAASEKGLELIGANDCTACHSIRVGQGPNTGPAYEDVAAKYTHAADTTVNRLVKKIITGGTGVWGTNVMTPHPALSEADVRTMVNYILSLKKA